MRRPVYSYFGVSPDSCTGYDSDISVWLSVDPLSDKYPSMSAYMYTAGNPVMLVDPDGRKSIKMDNEFGLNGEKISDYGGDKTDYHHQKKGTVVIKDHKSGKEKGSMPVGAFYASYGGNSSNNNGMWFSSATCRPNSYYTISAGGSWSLLPATYSQSRTKTVVSKELKIW